MSARPVVDQNTRRRRRSGRVPRWDIPRSGREQEHVWLAVSCFTHGSFRVLDRVPKSQITYTAAHGAATSLRCTNNACRGDAHPFRQNPVLAALRQRRHQHRLAIEARIPSLEQKGLRQLRAPRRQETRASRPEGERVTTQTRKAAKSTIS